MEMKAIWRPVRLSGTTRQRRALPPGVRFGLLFGGVLSALLAPDLGQAGEKDQENRLVGYKLLAQSLSDEASLKWLRFARGITLKGPAKPVANLMERISKVSAKRAEELEKLRKLPPNVTGKPPPSPLGDAIQASAKGLGIYEMIFSNRTFNMRFILLQAQATRMIAVIADQTAKIEPNETRKRWLKQLSKEYESIREDIVSAVEGCPVGNAASAAGS